MSIEGKVALVTGASRGIGKAIACELGKVGAIVIGTATSESGAENISKYLAAEGIQGKGVMLNVQDTTTIPSLLDAISEEFSAPAILVNNAGITRDNLFLRMKEDEWTDVINTNLNAIYYLSKACIKAMTKARWGRIINISSVVGTMGNPGQANYAASKAGIEGFTRALGKEIAARNITVNSIAPGFIETDMTKALSEDQRDAAVANVPAKRFGQPEDIATAAAFLASEKAGYITGITLHVNGGMYM